jgi:hypothetical protein
VPITFDCPCGKALRVADEHANRRVKCPACGLVGVIPAPEPQFEVVEPDPEPQFEVVEDPPAPRSPPPVPAKKSASTWEEDDEDDARGYSLAKKNREEEEDEKPRSKKKMPNFREGSGREDDDDEPRSRKKKKKRRRYSERPPQYQDNSGRSLEGNIINGGVAAGVLVMFIAVVWFVVGLYCGWVFFYPPVLFIVGLIAFFKGLLGQE